VYNDVPALLESSQSANATLELKATDIACGLLVHEELYDDVLGESPRLETIILIYFAYRHKNRELSLCRESQGSSSAVGSKFVKLWLKLDHASTNYQRSPLSHTSVAC
jgi:hypothetical protein